jgi:hypothetical protein
MKKNEMTKILIYAFIAMFALLKPRTMALHLAFRSRCPASYSQKILRMKMSQSILSNEESTKVQSGLLKNFVSNIIEDDLSNGRNGGRVVTRFPPEPNGYLHLGHAKSVNFNFAIAAAYNGVTNMRFDDTNPAKEEMEYVLSILDDVRWLVTGNTKAEPAPWNGSIRHASDYFQVIYDAAEYLILNNLAYVDDLTQGIDRYSFSTSIYILSNYYYFNRASSRVSRYIDCSRKKFTLSRS